MLKSLGRSYIVFAFCEGKVPVPFSLATVPLDACVCSWVVGLCWHDYCSNLFSWKLAVESWECCSMLCSMISSSADSQWPQRQSSPDILFCDSHHSFITSKELSFSIYPSPSSSNSIHSHSTTISKPPNYLSVQASHSEVWYIQIQAHNLHTSHVDIEAMYRFQKCLYLPTVPS